MAKNMEAMRALEGKLAAAPSSAAVQEAQVGRAGGSVGLLVGPRSMAGQDGGTPRPACKQARVDLSVRSLKQLAPLPLRSGFYCRPRRLPPRRAWRRRSAR